MLDATLRPRLQPGLERAAGVAVARGVGPLTFTLVGLVLGLAASVAAGSALWWVALALWLISRVFDGLDGPVARLGGRSSAFGGWADFTSDMAVYGSFVAGCAIGQPDARVACLVLLVTYYVNAGTLLGLSAAAEKARIAAPDDRTFHFTRGLAEGTETIVVHALMVLVPSFMAPIAWIFSGVVLITIGQRVRLAHRMLGGTPAAPVDPPSAPADSERAEQVNPAPLSPTSGSRRRQR
jgi:phosphatidylglycerophosphate synthase